VNDFSFVFFDGRRVILGSIKTKVDSHQRKTIHRKDHPSYKLIPQLILHAVRNGSHTGA
jgi:hypothetical protein